MRPGYESGPATGTLPALPAGPAEPVAVSPRVRIRQYVVREHFRVGPVEHVFEDESAALLYAAEHAHDQHVVEVLYPEVGWRPPLILIRRDPALEVHVTRRL